MRNNEKLQTEQQQQTKSNAINFDKMYFWKSFVEADKQAFEG